MPLFSPTAWMMRGGGGASQSSPATILDKDPYKNGKKKVKVELSQDAVLIVSSNKSKFVLKFAIKDSGFTENKTSVQIGMKLKKDGGGWGYTNSLANANFEKVGTEQTFDISRQINGSGVKKLLTDSKYGNVGKNGNGVCYLFFETNDEISSGQKSCKIKADN